MSVLAIIIGRKVITLQAKAIKKEEQSEIIRSLNKIVKLAGIVIIPIGFTLFIEQFIFAHETLKVSIQAMVASVIGMIPEGLFLLASVTKPNIDSGIFSLVFLKYSFRAFIVTLSSFCTLTKEAISFFSISGDSL